MAQQRQLGTAAFDQHYQPVPTTDHRIHLKTPTRPRRPLKPASSRRHRHTAAAVVVTAILLGVTIFLAFRLLSSPSTSPNGNGADSDADAEGNGTRKNWGRWRNPNPKELRFGMGGGVRSGRDSRYWDRDDRRRDEDYTEEESSSVSKKEEKAEKNGVSEQKVGEDLSLESGKGRKDEGLYNEGGRKELEEYEAMRTEAVDPKDEYDDGMDGLDELEENAGHGEDSERKLESGNGGGGGSGDIRESEKDVVLKRNGMEGVGGEGENRGKKEKEKKKKEKSGAKKKFKRKKASSTCEMKFLNSTAQLVEPALNKKFASFSLQYTQVEERPLGSEDWKPRFAGHQTLPEREESYYARDQQLNCGFVKGPNGTSTGFDISEDDRKHMSSCHVVVSSCIFGNSDRLRTPFGKTVTSLSKKTVCFAMFLDEITLQTLESEGQKMDGMGFIGLWKIILVKNLPDNDMRRVGKIPKFLAHRLFPSSRFSIWLDSKLRLQTDPLLILEYFLWRHGHEYAISNHYDRHCVWEEVAQNKKLNKFNHTIIDQQFEFYQADGLKRFDPSDPNKLLPSYVPEGSFIVREHTPMSNLFSCLWYNEVDRFTPRDQLSFAYTNLKLSRMNPGKHFYLNMFKDCERRSIAKLFHHRADEKKDNPSELMR